MCFSATASFGASIMLASIGTVAIKKAKTPSLRVLAIIPFVFSLQQFSEGWVWLSLTKEAFAVWKQPSMYAFLFFAEVTWPICISFSMMRVEKHHKRKQFLKLIFYVGIALSLVLSFSLFYYRVDARVLGSHVMYSIDSPVSFKSITNLFYLLTAVIPPFLSSQKKDRWIGVILIVSYIVAKIFYADFIISIWCYFATMISLVVLWIILDSPEKFPFANK